ncbi:ATP-binding protein [Actinokineospora sp.]|uniref:ATP-binding protein n=1 Tax=Actinokineospora sp. TaxID=1872133 RepID=UPI003D6BA0C3
MITVGVGKTHVAQALGHMAIRHGADVRFAKTSRVLADLAGGHADGTWGRRLRELARPPVLILDLSRLRGYSDKWVAGGGRPVQGPPRGWAGGWGFGIITGFRWRPFGISLSLLQRGAPGRRR